MANIFVDFCFPNPDYNHNMDKSEPTAQAGTPDGDIQQFKESFETFNKIINNLQRQYLTLEREYGEQGRKLEEINHQLRITIAANRSATVFLNSILTSLTSGVVAVDHTGIISHFNPAAERITGISTARALGHKYDEVMSTSAGEKLSALETVMTGTEFDSEEKRIVNNDGESIPVSVSTALLKDDAGYHRGAVEIFFDLTKIHKLEAEITRVKTLAALGEMAATVAHEVRNPLGGIGGFASLLRRELEGDENKIRLVDKIIAGVNTLNQTVAALLDYTRRDQLSLTEVSVGRLIDESVEYEKADESGDTDGIDFMVRVSDRNLRLKCDPHLMRQVLLNLFRNSREAMPEGGSIMIRAGRIDDAAGMNVTLPAVAIEVEDTGCGISPADQSKIFRPFFSTKHKKNGSGLGLASVWKTVQAHGGEMVVISDKGKGATFRMVLPINP